MTPAQKSEYLAAAQDVDNALVALAAGRARGKAALDAVVATSDRHELHQIDSTYGLRWFDQATQQSAGSKGLLPLFAGSPATICEVGVRAGGSVVSIMSARIG